MEGIADKGREVEALTKITKRGGDETRFAKVQYLLSILSLLDFLKCSNLILIDRIPKHDLKSSITEACFV